jgi:hypothetical protein
MPKFYNFIEKYKDLELSALNCKIKKIPFNWERNFSKMQKTGPI